MATLASSTAQQTQKGGHTRTNKHKKRTGTKAGTRGRTKEAELRTQKHDMAAHIYHASDGFTGTYDQVKAHEDAHGLPWDKHGGHDPPPPGSGLVSMPARPLARVYLYSYLYLFR